MHKEYTIWDLVIALGLCVLFFMWSSCRTEQRIARKALAAMDKAETKYNGLSDIDTVGAHYCNTKHPVKVGKGQVRYIKGDTVTRYDTTVDVQYKDNIIERLKTVTVFKYVHDTTVQTDTVQDTRVIELLTAENKGLKQANNNVTSENADLRTTNGKLWFAILLLVVAVLAYIIIKSPKPWLK